MKLISIIDSLNPNTLVSLSKFVDSPYHAVRSDVSKIIQFVIKSVDNTHPSKTELWSHVYINTKYNDGKLRKLANEALKVTESFFSYESFKLNTHMQLSCLSQYCENFQIKELQNKLEKKISQELDSRNVVPADSYFHLYRAKRSLVYSYGVFERKKSYRDEKNFVTNLSTLNDLIDSNYELEKLRLLILRNAFSELTGSPLIELSHLHPPEPLKKHFFKSELLYNYYKIYDLLLGETKNVDFDELLIFLNKIVHVDYKEALSLYDNLNNYLARNLNAGLNYFDQWFKLLKFGLSSKLLLQFGKIDPTDYRNLVLAACRVNDFDWALNFVEDYKDYLSSEYRQSAYSFSKARIFRSMGRYTNVVETLQDVEYEDITYNLNSRLMLIMAFYELDEYDTLDSTIKAFKVFLRRKRNVSVKRKANFRDFCDVVYNLMRAGDRKDASRITKAEEIMVANKGIPSSWWLKEKIAEVSAVLGIKPNEQTTEDQTT